LPNAGKVAAVDGHVDASRQTRDGDKVVREVRKVAGGVSALDWGYSALRVLLLMSLELGWMEKFSLDSCWHSEKSCSLKCLVRVAKARS
jgi:hypothetical protein